MQDVFKVLRQIESNSSRNTKKAILQQNTDNELLKKFFLYAYNPRWIYGVGPKTISNYDNVKIAREKTPQENIDKIHQKTLFNIFPQTEKHVSEGLYDNIFDLCDELMQHPFGSQQDIDAVNTFLGTCSAEEYYWYSRLLLKDLKIGCTEKTVNEVFDGLIPVFEVMLAYPIQNHMNRLERHDAFQIQRKYNGFRFVTYFHEDGSLEFFTRNGIQLFNFPEVEEEFKNIKPLSATMVFDGELTDISGEFNDVQSKIMRDGPKTNLMYHIWDCLTRDEFERNESFDTLFTRYDLLCTIIPDNLQLIERVPELYRGTDIDEIWKWFEYAKAQKWEGVMVKYNVPYVRKRTDDMLKVKGYSTEDLIVVRVNEGTGRLAGMLGSVTVDYNGQDVNVGSGFSDSERDYYWKHPNEIIDKVIEVRFFEPTKNKKGTKSLQHPRYKGIRSDK